MLDLSTDHMARITINNYAGIQPFLAIVKESARWPNHSGTIVRANRASLADGDPSYQSFTK
jgi:hypothetical protein